MATIDRRITGKFRSNVRTMAAMLLIIVGCSAVVAGYEFVADPTGQSMHIGSQYLLYSPFDSYLIPGILLLVFNGIFNLICAWFLFRRFRQGPNFLMFQGAILSIWIVTEIAIMRDFNLLHVLCLCIGLFFLFTGNWIRFK